MFESLSDRLGGVFDRLKKRGALNESDVTTALREVCFPLESRRRRPEFRRVGVLRPLTALPAARPERCD